tara:strand:- start:119 stop:388 length:270 start_codon:yes stop_codon:yes gene_type:complete
MKGLNLAHHKYLNELVHETLEKRVEIYNKIREIYCDDKLALEQIDIYDCQSQYNKHKRIYLNALKNNNEKIILKEEEWFIKNYQLTNNF